MQNAIKILMFLIFPFTVAGQGTVIDDPKLLFNNEQTIGIFLNSNGVGADFRFAQYINVRKDRIYEVSFDYLKHPKEYRSVVAVDYYSRRFIFGKENLFWEFKGQIGNQHEIFRKYDYTSISIRASYSGGISLGFQKPVYYEILSFSGTGQIENREEKKFDPAIHYYNYGGTASFTKGLNELKLIPGITVNTGLNFEYSERQPMIHALEAGMGFTLYPSPIRIMAVQKSSYFFFNIYVGYRFGSMLDISESSLAKSRKERRKERKEATQSVPLIQLF